MLKKKSSAPIKKEKLEKGLEMNVKDVLTDVNKHFKKNKEVTLNNILLYVNKKYNIDDDCINEFIIQLKNSPLFKKISVAEDDDFEDNKIINDTIDISEHADTTSHSLLDDEISYDNVDSLINSAHDIDNYKDTYDEYNSEKRNEVEKINYSNIEKMSNSIKVNDAVRYYLNNLGNQPLLSKEEEYKLAKQLKSPNKFLAKKAKEKLIIRNLRLVINNAKRYTKRGLTLLDLIEEGSLGLIKGIEKFDYKLGWRLSTYATCWIIQAMTRALADQSRMIRIPVHMVEIVNKLYKSELELSCKLNREPTQKEIKDYIGTSISEDKISLIKTVNMKPISLEKPIASDENTFFGDFLKDENTVDPGDHAAYLMLKKGLNQVFKELLTAREEEILRMRFALDPYKKVHKLKEVGLLFNITRERARQIEHNAKDKLKNSLDIKKYAQFLKL